MDQAFLYELQIGSHKEPKTFDKSTIGERDKFIINYIKNNFDVSESLNIAELSIGDGSLSQALVTSLNNIKLTCVDISPSRIEMTRDGINHLPNKSSSEVEYLECNFDTQFHFLPSSNFDITIALDIMEHVFDVFNFIENCRRILKENGVMLLRVPNIAYFRHRLKLLFGLLPTTASWFEARGKITAWQERFGWDGGHLHNFNIPILRQLLNIYGFDIILCRDPGCRFSYIRNISPKLLYSNPLIVAQKNEKCG